MPVISGVSDFYSRVTIIVLDWYDSLLDMHRELQYIVTVVLRRVHIVHSFTIICTHKTRPKKLLKNYSLFKQNSSTGSRTTTVYLWLMRLSRRRKYNYTNYHTLSRAGTEACWYLGRWYRVGRVGDIQWSSSSLTSDSSTHRYMLGVE